MKSATSTRSNDSLPLDARKGQVALALLSVLGHGSRNRVVETAIEDVEVGRANLGLLLNGELRHDLADIPITVDDVLEREAALQKLSPVARRAVQDLFRGARSSCRACRAVRRCGERVVELVEKERNAKLELHISLPRRHPPFHALLSSVDNRLTVYANEITKRGQLVRPLRARWLKNRGGRGEHSIE